MRRALTCLIVAVTLSGCGNDRTPAPDLGVIRAPGGFHRLNFAKAGVSLKAPVTWQRSAGEGRRVISLFSGDAQIAVWRYPRTEPLPESRAQLDATRRSLIAQVRVRDATFRLTSARLIRKAGLRAVELVGVGTNQGARRSIRSLHAYGHKAEVVVDAFAPTKDFPRVDEQTFRPVLRSARLGTARG